MAWCCAIAAIPSIWPTPVCADRAAVAAPNTSGWPEKHHRCELSPSGKIECDEYPFASTMQGAYYAQGNFSVLAVSAEHNKGEDSHGAALGSFYGRTRITTGDPFWVWIVP
ncbi:NucA/NucB deoxyribonuclease domain-containing protein [Herbidospora mongoliensis]|uniref:NucA/NucB deoxyribonuclease domain-containing protein n=1 Tax=Herbidospora mongoliensis TaxID=688067 RepID=UPI0009FD65FE